MKFTTVAGVWIFALAVGGGWLFVSNNRPSIASNNKGTKAVNDFLAKIDDYWTNDNIINRAQAAVRAELRDPDSAQFKNVFVIGTGYDKTVCGNVNARNGFGGYTGFTPFIYYSFEKVRLSNTELTQNSFSTNAKEQW